MKARILTTFVLSAIGFGASIGAATEPPGIEELPSALCDEPIVVFRKVYLNESLAELGSRLYDKVDYELQLRTLTRDIRVAEAELVQQRERLRIYEQFFGYPDAGLLTLQNARLDVLKSEEQLKLLHQTKLLALRYRSDQIRYRKLLLSENAALVQLAE